MKRTTWGYPNLWDALIKAEVDLEMETKSIMGVKTPIRYSVYYFARQKKRKVLEQPKQITV